MPPLIIDMENAELGNRAMANVLLLYFHILREGGITNDQTVHLERDFDAFAFLDVELGDERLEQDIDVGLIREGAVIALLCDLDDMVQEYEDDYRSQDLTRKILAAFRAGRLSAIPQTGELLAVLDVPERSLDHARYRRRLAGIVETYVAGRFRRMLG